MISGLSVISSIHFKTSPHINSQLSSALSAAFSRAASTASGTISTPQSPRARTCPSRTAGSGYPSCPVTPISFILSPQTVFPGTSASVTAGIYPRGETAPASVWLPSSPAPSGTFGRRRASPCAPMPRRSSNLSGDGTSRPCDARCFASASSPASSAARARSRSGSRATARTSSVSRRRFRRADRHKDPPDQPPDPRRGRRRQPVPNGSSGVHRHAG